jgi:pimeloyl-ACP methyl ester carboxylesterase
MIAWEESGAGPPVVFVHGITEDRRGWDRVVPLFDGFRCVRLDLRGHGESSDAEDYSALAMAEDVAEVVREARIDEPPLLIGHSLGAFVVTVYAAQAPTKAVVNVDQSLRIGEFAVALQTLADELRGPGFADAVDAIIRSLGIEPLAGPDLEYASRKHRDARQDVVLGVWEQVLDSSPADLDALVESVLPAVQVPYLAIHGSDPGAGYAEWLRSLVPHATVELWDGDGHYLHLVEPDRFAARVREFASK